MLSGQVTAKPLAASVGAAAGGSAKPSLLLIDALMDSTHVRVVTRPP